MALSFYPPSYRASQSDLTISISPLGLVEMADEEFEVHGVRLSRYSLYWAHYLGHMYAYRREVGEPQFAANYVRALSDYITNFTFGKGVTFRTPPATSAIVPPLLKRVWEQDNRKESVLWEMGQTSGVAGDCFVKVAYEDPYVDSIGRMHPGRVRILPLNPAHCFPQWHEHDRQRMLSFKLKYRFWTTAPDGTRQVMTYVERISETGIEEFVNDELIDARPNPLGVIPIVYIPNNPVSGSPWGTPDIADIIGLNREFNEKALEISDIINYHSAPITVVVGAKSSQLEKGPRKTWTLPKDASVTNLQALVELQGPLAYMDMVKRVMHEMTGVPEQALGQMQPISNTSGVALHIQYQPLMNRYNMKKLHFSSGFQRINELILLTLFQKEPWTLEFDPREGTMPDEGALLVLDPNDPNTYETSTHWPPPLPVDILVKLNEIMAKMNLGLESKRGALRELGEEFPEEKMAEIFAELLEDQKESAALQLREAATAMATYLLTGMPPDGSAPQGTDDNGDGSSVTSAGDGSNGSQGQPIGAPSPEVANIAQDLVTRAYGTRMAQYRNPSNK
jgi:ribosomal protein S8